MVVSFDTFGQLDTPALILCNPGCAYVNNNTTLAVGELPSVSDFEATYNFNTMSELRFRVHGTAFQDDDRDQYIREMFDMVLVNRYIFIPAIGYFVITAADRTSERGDLYRDVTAKSAEIELERRGVPYIQDGTYKLRKSDVSEPDGLLDILQANLTGWTIDHIDDSLKTMYRTFNDVSVKLNIYEFLTKNVQDAYECIVLFDVLNRTINFYAKAEYIVPTDIHLTERDWVNRIVIQEDSESIYTALNTITTEKISSSFDDTITIAAVNPTGSNIMYNFSLYYSWMSPSLSTKVQAWQADIDAVAATFYSAASSYYDYLEDKMNAVADKQKYQIYVNTYDQCITNIDAAQGNADQVVLVAASANETLNATGGTPVSIADTIANTRAGVVALKSAAQQAVADAQAAITAAETNMAPYQTAMETVVGRLAPSAYFTAAERKELSYYIYEGTYDDPYVAATETMTTQERIALMRILYMRTQRKLATIASVSKKLRVETESFIFIEKFADWSQQLVTGCLINVEVAPDVIEQLFLSSINVNYEEKSSSLTFGNKLERHDAKSMFDDVLDNISRIANSSMLS